jgi:hypothetical protein
MVNDVENLDQLNVCVVNMDHVVSTYIITTNARSIGLCSRDNVDQQY